MDLETEKISIADYTEEAYLNYAMYVINTVYIGGRLFMFSSPLNVARSPTGLFSRLHRCGHATTPKMLVSSSRALELATRTSANPVHPRVHRYEKLKVS